MSFNGLGMHLGRRGGDSVLPQLLRELVCAVLGAREDECLVDGMGAYEVREQLALSAAINRMDDLPNEVGGGTARGDLTDAGRWRRPSASARIFWRRRAEKSRFWRRAGSSDGSSGCRG